LDDLIGLRRAVRIANGTMHWPRHPAVDRFDIKFELLTAGAKDFDFHEIAFVDRAIKHRTRDGVKNFAEARPVPNALAFR
jgi:hypothetical protein